MLDAVCVSLISELREWYNLPVLQRLLLARLFEDSMSKQNTATRRLTRGTVGYALA